MKAHYTRLFADERGESCFEDVWVEMRPLFSVQGVEPLFMGPITLNEGFFWGGAPATWNGEAQHPAPRRFLAVVARGIIEITTSTGVMRLFGPGDAYLVEDTVGVGHFTRVVGEEEHFAFAVALPSS